MAVYSSVLYFLRGNNNHVLITRILNLVSVQIYQIILCKYLRNIGFKAVNYFWGEMTSGRVGMGGLIIVLIILGGKSKRA